MSSESLHIGINDVYMTHVPQSSVKVMNDVRLIKEWLVDDPRALIEMAVDAGHEDDMFEGVRMKQHLNKIFDIFEPTKIIIEEK